MSSPEERDRQRLDGNRERSPFALPDLDLSELDLEPPLFLTRLAVLGYLILHQPNPPRLVRLTTFVRGSSLTWSAGGQSRL